MMQLAVMMAAMQYAAAATYQSDPSGLPAGIAIAAIVGFSPEHLAAAGLSAEQASTILQQLGSSTLADDAIVKLFTSPPSADAQQPEVDSSPAKLLRLRHEAMAIAGISPQSDVGRKLTAVINSAGRSVPAELRVVERTEEQWQALEAALVAEARAERLGRELSDEAASTLSTARADAAVAAACSGYKNRCNAIEHVFSAR